MIEQLKSKGHYFAAGALAAESGSTSNYGCHYGMRSELAYAKDMFRRGFESAKENLNR